MDQGRRLALTVALVAACKSSEQPPAPPPPPPPPPRDAAMVDEARVFTALEKKVALYELRRTIKVEAEASAAWPTDDVAGLDFTPAGNAIIAYKETGLPFVTASKARPFELLPLAEDPWRVVGSEPVARTLQPAVEHLIRARYVLFVMGNQDQPMSFEISYTPAKLAATGMLFEIATAKLLGGVSFSATNTEGLSKVTDDSLMADFEHNARAALWASVKARFPSAKTP